MLELLQTSLPTVTEPQWAWLADATDSEVKWGALVVISRYLADLGHEWVDAWRDVERDRAVWGNDE